MGGGGEAPEPAGRGGVGLPRRIYPQVPRRQRGFYIGGAGRDDGGYFALTPEQDYGGADDDDCGGFAPAPEQVYGGACRFIGDDLAPLAEGIPFRVPRPGGSPGRDRHLPFARGRAPPPLLEGAPGNDDDMTGARGGNQHGEGGALGAAGNGGGEAGALGQGRR